MEVRIELASAAATKATLRVTYTVRNARWTPLYDARLDTGGKDRKPALELVRRAEITQETGEDWSNVALAVSTVRTARGGKAPDLNSLIVQYPQLLRSAASVSAPASAPADECSRCRFGGGASDAVRKGGRETGRGRSRQFPGGVQDSRPRQPRRQRRRQEPARLQREHRARSGGTRRAGDESDRIPRSELQADRGRPFVARRGRGLPRWRLRRPGLHDRRGKDETVRLGFGADDKIKIERTVVKRNEGSAGLIVTTSKTDERSFKTTVRNGHDFPIRIAIEDQLPVSENEDIVVEMLPSTTAPTATNLRDKRGVLEWAFEAKAGEVRDINFAWRIRWPKDKGVVMVPAG